MEVVIDSWLSLAKVLFHRSALICIGLRIPLNSQIHVQDCFLVKDLSPKS